MKIHATLLALLVAALPLCASSPEAENAFVEKYKQAIESGDAEALAGFLYTKGAGEEQIEFFKMMQTPDPGAKLKSITIVTPDPEMAAKYNEPMVMPDGVAYVLPVPVTRQLVVEYEFSGPEGSGSQTSKSPVAEIDGQLLIPVPVPAPAKSE